VVGEDEGPAGATWFEHVIVIALENRSYDHLLGYLDHPANGTALGPDGLIGGTHTNPGPDGPVAAAAGVVPPVGVAGRAGGTGRGRRARGDVGRSRRSAGSGRAGAGRRRVLDRPADAGWHPTLDMVALHLRQIPGLPGLRAPARKLTKVRERLDADS